MTIFVPDWLLFLVTFLAGALSAVITMFVLAAKNFKQGGRKDGGL